MLWALGLTLVLLLLYSLWYHSQTAHLIREQAELRQRTDDAQIALMQLLDSQKALNADALRAQLAETRDEITQRKRALELIETQDMGNTTGFSGQLRALAAQSQPSVSLEAFTLLAGGAQVELHGKTSEPKAVPRYLALLHSTGAFARSTFGVLNLEQNEGAGFPFSVTAPTLKEAKNEEP
jgi:hypothetical protein